MRATKQKEDVEKVEEEVERRKRRREEEREYSWEGGREGQGEGLQDISQQAITSSLSRILAHSHGAITCEPICQGPGVIA